MSLMPLQTAHQWSNYDHEAGFQDTYEGYYLRWFTCQPMRQFFVVGDEMRNVNIAVVLLYKNIFSYLISARSQ